jgi:hypothetical protein
MKKYRLAIIHAKKIKDMVVGSKE